MTRPGRILLLALALPASGVALAQGPSEGLQAERDVQELPGKLRSFIDEAIDEGLLTPAEMPAPDKAAAADPAPATIAQPAASKQAEPARAAVSCALTDPLDFAAYGELRNYGDLIAWRESKAASVEGVSDIALAKAFLSLGLNEEARLQLSGLEDETAYALRQLAHLLEGRKVPEINYFRTLADCHDSAGTWLSVALLQSRQPEGTAQLERHFAAFREMPLQLRIQVSGIAVPALEQMDATLMAEKLMASFSHEEVNRSARLAFNEAILDMNEGSEQAEKVLRRHLSDPAYRSQAAGALMKHGRPVDKEYREDFANSLIDDVGRLPEDVTLSAGLDIMLQDLNGVADYGLIWKLADLPATQAPDAREKLQARFAGLLRRDLSSVERLDNLTAINELMGGYDLLEGHDDADALTRLAVDLAIDLGFQNLANKLARRAGDDETLAYAQASLAYRLEDYEVLKQLSKVHPAHQGILLLAAKSAIHSRNQTWLDELEPKLMLEEEALVELLECDSMHGGSMVSERIYNLAQGFEDETLRARVERLSALRDGKLASPRSNYDVSEVPARLERVGLALTPNTKEAH